MIKGLHTTGNTTIIIAQRMQKQKRKAIRSRKIKSNFKYFLDNPGSRAPKQNSLSINRIISDSCDYLSTILLY